MEAVFTPVHSTVRHVFPAARAYNQVANLLTHCSVKHAYDEHAPYYGLLCTYYALTMAYYALTTALPTYYTGRLLVHGRVVVNLPLYLPSLLH